MERNTKILYYASHWKHLLIRYSPKFLFKLLTNKNFQIFEFLNFQMKFFNKILNKEFMS